MRCTQHALITQTYKQKEETRPLLSILNIEFVVFIFRDFLLDFQVQKKKKKIVQEGERSTTCYIYI